MYEIYTKNHTPEEREEVLEAIGLRWNSQKCTTVYYNIYIETDTVYDTLLRVPCC